MQACGFMRRNTVRMYVNSMPFMVDMDTHAGDVRSGSFGLFFHHTYADNCKRILFFTRAAIDQVQFYNLNRFITPPLLLPNYQSSHPFPSSFVFRGHWTMHGRILTTATACAR